MPEPAGDLDVFDAESRREIFRRAADTIRGHFAPHTWQAFWLTTIDDLPAAEVGRRLGISVGAVYIAKSRVPTRLRGVPAVIVTPSGDVRCDS